MEKECLNCGATEQNWAKSCAGCNGEFCYKCIDEHFHDFTPTETLRERWEKASFERGVREAIKLSDEIEAKSPTSPMEEWKAFKQFRNTLRDKFNL